MGHTRGDVEAGGAIAPDREHALGMLKRAQPLQPGQDAALGGRQVTRNNPGSDAPISDG
jgi:hypothetical protein